MAAAAAVLMIKGTHDYTETQGSFMWEEVGSSGHYAEGTTRSLVQTCDRHGIYISFLTSSGEYTSCAQCATRTKDDSPQAATSIDVSEHLPWLTAVPEHLHRAVFGTFKPQAHWHYVMLPFAQQIMREWSAGDVAQCGQIVFLGDAGVGKSHVAVAMLRNLSYMQAVAYVDTAAGIAPVSSESFVLVLDNLFNGAGGAEANHYWNEVILDRASRELPTIMISRLSGAKFRRTLAQGTLHWLRLSNTKVVHFRDM